MSAVIYMLPDSDGRQSYRWLSCCRFSFTESHSAALTSYGAVGLKGQRRGGSSRSQTTHGVARFQSILRDESTLPVCVGFGVSGPEQAAAVARIADGVVVGSAIVRAAGESVDAAARLTASLRAAIDAA